MAGGARGPGEPLIPRPGLTLPEIRAAVATMAPGRLPEMFTKMQDIVEIERHPETARRLHDAERALMSEDPAIREAAIAKAREIVRAAHKAIAEE
jgi:hypothetical protein